MRFILSIPIFLYLLVLANIFMLGGLSQESWMNVIVADFPLPSARRIVITVSDSFILASIVALYIETFKATRTSVISIVDHTLSLGVFVVFLIEFMVMPRLGNSTFLILTVSSFIDVVMGFTVTISTAKRDITFGG
jgi:hypothetical protein